MIRINVKQGSDEWLELRRTKITGTDAAVIMGLSPYKKPKKLFEQKLGITPPDFVTPAMLEGSRLEAPAVEAFFEKTGVMTESVVGISEKSQWMMASCDGITFDGETLLEVKCGVKSYNQAKNGEIPAYYRAQMQHYMAVAEVEKTFYWAWRPDKPGILIEVLRDDVFIDQMIKALLIFMRAIDSRDISGIDEKPSIKAAKPLSSVDVILHHLSELKQQRAALDVSVSNFDAQEKQLKEKLIELTGGESVRGHGVELLRTTRKGSIVYKNIPELDNVDLEQYRAKESIVYRLTFEQGGNNGS